MCVSLGAVWYKRISQFLGVVLLLVGSAHSYAKDWVYTVKPGDTLWDLCIAYTTKKNCWLEVGDYNGVGYPPSLAPGTRIRFPVPWLKAQPVPATVVFIVGDVQVAQPNGDVQPATPNTLLSMGAQVKVPERASATIQFADGAILVLEPNSHVVMNLLTQHQHTGMVNTQLNLLYGAAKSRVPKRQPRSNFSVSTPSAIAAVRGTDFRVSANDGSMRGEVFEGLVNVAKPSSGQASSRNNPVDLAKNYGLSVKNGEPLGLPVKLLAPVSWTTNHENVTLPYTLSWEAQAKARAYKVELLANSAVEEVIHSDYQQASTWLLPIDDDQCFKVRISAIDEFDLQGMPAIRDLCAAKPLVATDTLVLNKRQLQWDPVEGASMYLIESSVDGSFSSPEFIAQTGDTFYALGSDAKGLYVRITPIDKHGRAGLASNPVAVKWTNVQGVIATLLFMLALAL